MNNRSVSRPHVAIGRDILARTNEPRRTVFAQQLTAADAAELPTRRDPCGLCVSRAI